MYAQPGGGNQEPASTTHGAEHLLLELVPIAEHLRDIVALAAEQLHASCAVMLRSGGQLCTAATSDARAGAMSDWQFTNLTGPSIAALDDKVAAHFVAGAARRWPAYERFAAAHRCTSSMSMPLLVEASTIGAFSAYRHAPRRFTVPEQQTAQQFAGQAAATIDYLHRIAVGADLSSAVAGRPVIDTALGSLMARGGYDGAHALATLRADAAARGIRVTQAAGELVDTASRGGRRAVVRTGRSGGRRTMKAVAGFLARTDDPDVRRPPELQSLGLAQVRPHCMDPFDDYEARTTEAGVLQDLLLRTETLEDFLTELATRAARETDHRCGITVRGDQGRPYTVATSDELTRTLDELQYVDGAGPCLEALASGVPVFVTDMATESRWAPYPEHALEIGARSSMSYPLISGEVPFGALNLYAFEPLAPGPPMQVRAAHIAEHAAGAVAIALRIAEHSKATDNLRTALTSRSTIDQAIGILMAQQRCDARSAFALLRQASQGRNIKLREVAAGIVTAVERGSPTERRGRY